MQSNNQSTEAKMKTQQSELFDTNRTITLRLNCEQAYQRKQKLWQAYLNFAARVRRAFFPDTGGSGHLMHNWYVCDDKRNPKGSALAEWIEKTTYARYQRLEEKMKARSVMREHLTHGADFNPLWCPLCNPH